jgi:multicomponent Na+:H+ antiporter subunit D
MVFGLALFTPIAVAAGLFHIIHNMIAKTALILAGGIMERVGGSEKLGEARGLARTYPWLAAGFFVPAMSLAGMPPFSGFWGKWFLVVGGFDVGAFRTTAVSLLVGLITLASMLKIWTAVFWGKPTNEQGNAQRIPRSMLGPLLGLGAMTIAVGLLAPPIFTHFERVARQILSATPYIHAVLGPTREEPATKDAL